jgi:hypothetical protein
MEENSSELLKLYLRETYFLGKKFRILMICILLRVYNYHVQIFTLNATIV